jgi:uncharacterized protein with GYD domain
MIDYLLDAVASALRPYRCIRRTHHSEPGGIMAQYVVLTRVSPDAVQQPDGLLQLEKQVKKRVAEECPEVKWVTNLAVMGPYDYLDIFEAPDNESAMKVSTIIRSVGHGATELWPATNWDQFRDRILK